MPNYLYESGVHYRWEDEDSRLYGGETVCYYKLHHEDFINPIERKIIINGNTDQLYKLTNHWNRSSYFNKHGYFYEAP